MSVRSAPRLAQIARLGWFWVLVSSQPLSEQAKKRVAAPSVDHNPVWPRNTALPEPKNLACQFSREWPPSSHPMNMIAALPQRLPLQLQNAFATRPWHAFARRQPGSDGVRRTLDDVRPPRGQVRRAFAHVRSLLGQVRRLLGRVRCLLGRVRSLLDRVRRLLGRVRCTLARVRCLWGRVRCLLGRVLSQSCRVRSLFSHACGTRTDLSQFRECRLAPG